jgi:peptide/nickel transport system ATP-binding protein
MVSEECRTTEPRQTIVGPGREAACIRPLGAAAITANEGAFSAEVSSERIVLRVDQLEKLYSAGRGLFARARNVAAVKGVSFDIVENEFVALVGESGSGKSTIAKLLAGLERPTGGRIYLDGEDLTEPETRRRIRHTASLQMVFQDPQSALNPRRRVASIVTQAMEAGNQPWSWQERLTRTKQLLEEVGLSRDLAAMLPGQLSGGQRQRVNIGRALCKIPKILIADEIVSGLDVSVQAQLLDLLERLRREFGFAMLFICHDLSVVRHLCSRILVMYRGEIVERGPVETVFANPQHPHTRALLSSVPPDEPAADWLALEANRPAATIAAALR